MRPLTHGIAPSHSCPNLRSISPNDQTIRTTHRISLLELSSLGLSLRWKPSKYLANAAVHSAKASAPDLIVTTANL
jgi:hypothetical protein